MRTDVRKQREIKTGEICGYHHGTFGKKLVFVSDRPQKADEYYRLEDGTMPCMFGLEIETQNWGITSRSIYANVLKQIVFQFFPENLWKYERDGSLDENADSSAECISQPMTKAFIRNHYRDFKSMYEWFSKIGTSCDRTGQCGMHTHMSITNFGRTKGTQDEALRKFYYIINKHYDLFRIAFARRLDQYGRTGYFGRETITMTQAKNLNFANFRYSDDHHTAVNLGHYYKGDIELRLVGGQSSYGCFRNTMETLFHLIETVKHISWTDCDSIVKIFSGCNQYVYDRLATLVRNEHFISDSQLAEISPTVTHTDLNLSR